MKYILRHSCLFLLLLFVGQTAEAQYNIAVKIDNYENDTCILGYRLGKQTYVRDTLSEKNKKGQFVFKGEKNLEGGIYLILTKPNNVYFEFLVPNEKEQKNLEIHTKMVNGNDMSTNLKIKGSPDNKAFLDYLKFLRDMRKEDQVIAAKMSEAETETEKKELQLQREGLGKKVKDYQEKMMKDNPDYLSTALVRASIQPEVPEAIRGDRAKAFYWYRDHYWDNFDWKDERLIRTPIFKDKIENYTEKLCVQVSDSVIEGVDLILKKSEANEKMFQYAAAELLNKYAKSKVICMDAVYVFIGENYYCNGKAAWVDSAQLEKICDNVATLKPLRCGQYAPNIRLKKLDGTPINLYELKAPFTAIYFWDPTCGNCSKTTTKLVPVYNKYKKYGFEVFGVCSKNWKELDQCKEKVKDKKMDFINTSEEAYPLAVAKKIYDIKVNPYILLLDADKKIMWKRIEPKQLDNILKREFEKMGIKVEEEAAVEKKVEEEFEKKEKENEKKMNIKGK